MDKKVIFSVAGSGKTTTIISKLNLEERFQVITYTDDNEKNIKERVLIKFGFIPKNIKIFTYFSFLYSFCYRPFFSLKYKSKGIYWQTPPVHTSRIKHHEDKHFFHIDERIFHNRLAKFLISRQAISKITNRMEKYFDSILIDEVQDFAGNDFNFLMAVSKSKINFLMVGDFFQHTYDTSRDGPINRTLHDDFKKYKKRFIDEKIEVDEETLLKSYRCSETTCNFIKEKLEIAIESQLKNITEIKWITEQNIADSLYNCSRTVKLFYQEHQKYSCYSQNWGKSKGQDKYQDVCVVINKNTLKFFNENKLNELPSQTKNKLYVALSRAKGNLYLVEDNLYKKYKAASAIKS